jgi:hypothetical protein
MRTYLEEANKDLLYQIGVVQELLGRVSVCGELTPYVAHIVNLCEAMRQRAQRNLLDLSYGVASTYSDVLSATQNLSTFFEIVNSRLATPVVRARPDDDRLGLLVVRFLHDSHTKTASLPFAISDGSFAVYPTDQVPPVYLVPISRQMTLLYLPLLFHEFGHLLYRRHKDELDELVKDLQKVIARHLAPKAVRGRAAATRANTFRKQAVTCWYAWAQEFYCDAVGIHIGGPAYLKAFSHYFRTLSPSEYYIPRKTQLEGKHPVTWLRTKMLVDRARKYGLAPLATAVEQTWAECASAMGVAEDYEGLWSDDYFQPLRSTLDDMIEETQPRRFRDSEMAEKTGSRPASPVHLCNVAWSAFETDANGYRAWEKAAISAFLSHN